MKGNLLELKEIRRIARERFNGACRVCPNCNGRACAGEMPGIGGVGTGSSFMANFESLARIKLNLRTIHDAVAPEIETTFFGRPLRMPILVAPLAGMALNMGNAMDEREYMTGMIEGAKAAGSITFTCDGPSPIFFELGLELLKKSQGWGVPTIKPRPEETFVEMARQMEQCGVPAVATDIDAAGIVHMKRAGQPAGPWPFAVWERTISRVKLPVILKGVMTAAEAKLAAEAGAAGIIVSNHGGRQLDGTLASADALPAVVDAVGGRVPVLVDGGIRSGTDVVKALSIGAAAVLVTRPVIWGLVVHGAPGVEAVLKELAAEMSHAMALCGARTVADVDRGLIWGMARR